MAVITATKSHPPGMHEGVVLHTWSGLDDGSLEGAPVGFAVHSDRSVQVSGNFGGGTTVAIQGSNDGVNYHTLTDPQGSPLSGTAPFLEAVSELVLYIKPVITAGGSGAAIVVTMMGRIAT